MRKRRFVGALCVGVMTSAVAVEAQNSPPLPTDVPVWMVGHEAIDGRRLEAYSDVSFTMGGTDKNDALRFGERIEPRAVQSMSLTAGERDGRAVWVRSFETARVGDPQVLARGEIVLDRTTLAPLSSRLERGGSVTEIEYDWNQYQVRSSSGDVEAVDVMALEAAAHETWVAAVDWSRTESAMVPSILAGGGGKWWAVPRVVGREDVDIGDGERRSAFVVEMDWWGMGAAHTTYTPGGGRNGSAGTGGKYWVLVDPVPGTPRVVRVQTEANENVDSVIQLQGVDGM